MADEEARDQNFCEQIKTSPQKQSLPSTSHLIFSPSASCRYIREAMGVRWGGCLLWVKWRTMSWWRGGATWGESTSCGCLNIISISKIHLFRWNLHILSTRMSPMCCAKRIYAAAFFGWEIHQWSEASDMVEMLWCFVSEWWNKKWDREKWVLSWSVDGFLTFFLFIWALTER
jgi:hypothetical protein